MIDFNKKPDDNYDDLYGPDLNHNRIGYTAQDLFIESLISLKVNSPEAFKNWADSRISELNRLAPFDEQRELELIKRKTEINKETEELKNQMELNRQAK